MYRPIQLRPPSVSQSRSLSPSLLLLLGTSVTPCLDLGHKARVCSAVEAYCFDSVAGERGSLAFLPPTLGRPDPRQERNKESRFHNHPRLRFKPGCWLASQCSPPMSRGASTSLRTYLFANQRVNAADIAALKTISARIRTHRSCNRGPRQGSGLDRPNGERPPPPQCR